MNIKQGEYECKLDSKNRLRLPSQLLRQLGLDKKSREAIAAENVSKEAEDDDDDAHDIVIGRGLGPYLRLFTKEMWEERVAQFGNIDEYNIEEVRLRRSMFRGATNVSIDTADRVLIPRSLQAFAKLEDEVLISVYDNMIELWNPAEYEKALIVDPIALAELAQKIMVTDPKLKAEEQKPIII